ncbi:MAG TPA: ROK family glucokinase [Mycobacteriales bacterium]|nr:ROK family glucokinase [Mycobacteriales bacterium]
MALTIGIDIGGTKVAGGVVDDAGAVLALVRRPTPSLSPSDIVITIASVVDELRSGHAVEAVGIGAAGFVDAERSTVRFAPNLAWRDEPLRDNIRDRVGLPVVVENDANAMAWGEYRFGAGRGEACLLALTIGTGIGGGVVWDGRLYRGGFGIAGEFGHLRVVPDGRPCGCGNRGCWEQYCSGPALLREAIARHITELAGGDLETLGGPAITRAALEGDPTATECVTELGRWLGQGLADLAAAFDPTCFVIGGGVAEAGELLLATARRTFESVLTGSGHRPLARICAAELGTEAGLVGAADLARRRG